MPGSAESPQPDGPGHARRLGTVTLLSAPAGAGKTTLMSSWAENRAAHGERVAWVSLDAHDNNRVLFWTGLLTSAAHAAEGRRETPITSEFLDPPVDQLPEQWPLVQLESLLATSDAPLWLFLDDLQEIQSPAVLADLDALFRALPEGLGLVAATRRDPPVALHRLLLAGRLREVRASDLALERAEVRKLLQDHGVVLAERELSLLVERTEGWAAAVRLAALALSVADDPPSVLRDFAGDDRAVADYLAMEVLGRLGPTEQRLLRACAVPEQVTTELALALTGEPAGADLLDRLYRDNVLVMHLAQPGRWYRLHSMLRGYLLAELKRSDPQLLSLLHARTARWFAEHGHVHWAVTHAVSADDSALAIEMLTALGPTLLADGRTSVLHELIEAAGPEVLGDPDVRRLDALTDLETELPVPASLPWPWEATDAQVQQREGRSAALDALVALQAARLVDRRLSGAALAASDAVTDGEGGDLSLLLRQSRGIVLALTGQLDDADAELTTAYRLAVTAGNDHAQLRAMAAQTGVASSRCDFRRAEQLADDTLRFAAEIGQSSGPDAAFVLLQAAHAAYQRLDETAHRLAERALFLSDGVPEPTVRMSASGLLAALDFDSGRDPFQAARRLRDCWAIAAGHPISPLTATRIAYSQHRISWQVGRPDWAQEALNRLGDVVGDGGEVDVLSASEHLARGRATAARRRLTPVLDGATHCRLPLTLQHAWLIEAVLAADADEHVHSFTALNAALVLAEELQAHHVFVEVRGVTALLDEHSARLGRLGPLAESIRASALARKEQEFLPLTPKELELLLDLPAQLTLEEIAERHQVSINTVKTHVRSIYQKLNVGSRREAIALARRTGLL